MKIRTNLADRMISIVTLVIVFGTTLYLIAGWASFPDELPAHYNAAGEIDAWGGKGELLILSVMMTAIYLLMTLLIKFPGVWNTGVTVTPENRERVYRILKYMIETSRLSVSAVLSFLIINITLSRPLPGWFLPVFLLLIFGGMIFWGVRLIQSK